MKKSKWLAAILNLIPGVGYLYVGTRVVFGVLLMVLWLSFVVDGIMAPISSDSADVPFVVWDLLPLLAFEAAFAVDAFIEADRFNKSLDKQTK
jgi:hypothetical protein